MKQSNIKTPLVFRIGVALLCAILITSHMMGGLYARYHSSVTGNAAGSVAKISYKLTTPSNVSKHQLDMNNLPDNCNIVAVDETFSIENDGEVAYNYTINLSLTYPNGQALSGYSLTTPATTVWLVSDGQEATVASGTFYYYLNGTLCSSLTPTIAGSLGIGEKAICLFYYCVDFDDASLDQEIVINYDIRCEQID